MLAQLLSNRLQLEGKTIGGSPWSVPINSSPFVVGRKAGCNLHLAVNGVSRVHAEIWQKDHAWWLRDCDSTNGTFVNRRRLVGEHRLAPGDSLQFGDMHFTVAEYEVATERTQIINPHALQFERMMLKKAVTPHFQPIVRLPDATCMGYEILGRVMFPGLPQAPGPLFQIARKLDREVELSLMFREQAFAEADRQNLEELLFFNMLPAEMDVRLIAVSLAWVRRSYPALHLAMELHESVVTDAPMIKQLRQVLQDLDIKLVYDDFGSGQARLVELMDAPPDVIKFDISLIHDIDKRSESSQAIIAALVKMSKEAGITTLAEGVETAEEDAICKQVGFDLAQGFLYGKPLPLQESTVRQV